MAATIVTCGETIGEKQEVKDYLKQSCDHMLNSF